MDAHLDLYWVPLGAGASVVRVSGRVFDAIGALVQRRDRTDLYHAALVATAGGGDPALPPVQTFVEVAPVPDGNGREARGVVGGGAVGSRWLGSIRIFRYEVRRWSGGVIPDLDFAVDSPVRITDDPAQVERVLDLVADVPTPVWGRDELGAGEMWNSNSVVSWVLARAGLLERAGRMPAGGRAPGWDAGVTVARRHAAHMALAPIGR